MTALDLLHRWVSEVRTGHALIWSDTVEFLKEQRDAAEHWSSGRVEQMPAGDLFTYEKTYRVLSREWYPSGHVWGVRLVVMPLDSKPRRDAPPAGG